MPSIGQICLGGGQRALRRVEAALGRGHGCGVLIGGGYRLLALALGNRAGRREFRVGVFIEQRQAVGGLLLSEVGLSRGHIGFRLAHTSVGIELGLGHEQLVLLQLLLEDGDLILRRLCAGLGRRQRGARGVLARSNLRIVENGDHVAGFDAVALAHAHFENAPGGLWSDGGIVALDAAAHGDDTVRHAGRSKKSSPDDKGGHQQQAEDDEHRQQFPGARRLGRRRRRGHVACGFAALRFAEWLRRFAARSFVSPCGFYPRRLSVGGAHLAQVRQRKVRDVVGDPVQLFRRHLHLRPKPHQHRTREDVEKNLPHDAVRAEPRLLVIGREADDFADHFAQASIDRPHDLIDDPGHRRSGLGELAGGDAEVPVRQLLPVQAAKPCFDDRLAGCLPAKRSDPGPRARARRGGALHLIQRLRCKGPACL